MRASSIGRVVVVEDERLVALEIAENLEELGYEVPGTAATADEAIELVMRVRPDLVLLDIRIRGPRDGIEAARAMRERLGVPVAFMTACTDQATLDRAKSTDPYAYLAKPVSPTTLRTAVEIALHRARIERNLFEQSRWLSTTLRAIADGVVSVDADGLVTFMNPASERLTGWSMEDARGKPCEEVIVLIDEATRARARNPIVDAIALGGPTMLEPGTLLRGADGSECAIEDSAAPILNESGVATGAVMVFHDVSGERRLRQQAELNDRLVALGTLAAGIAHEVNNPLSYILGNQQHAQRQIAEIREAIAQLPQTAPHFLCEKLDALTQALDDASTGAERVRRIISELKMLGRPAPSRQETFDVHSVLDAALDLTMPELAQRARVVREFSECPRVRGDTVRLTQVLVNLLLNAAHAIAPDHVQDNEVRIVTGTSLAGGAQIEVRDTGSGIPKEVIPRIFEPFFTTRAFESGSGLGLSVSYGIVTSLGGTLEVESRVGVGSTFRILLPARVTDSSIPPPPGPLSIGPDEPRARLLLIDDERILLEALQRTLGEEFSVSSVTSGKAALTLFEANRAYDLVLCDLMMPGMTGMDLFRELERRFPQQAARTVFMTGGAFAQGAQDFLAAARRSLLEKPFSNEALFEFVRRNLHRLGTLSAAAR